MKTFFSICILFAYTAINAQHKTGPCPFTIILHPSNMTVLPGHNCNWVCGVTPTNNLTYQWQMDNGSGFVNMIDTGTISGSNTYTLQMYASASMNNYWFHCIVNDGSCSDTTPKHRLNVIDVGVLTHNTNNDGFSLYPNPATNKVKVKGLNESGTFYISDLSGKVILQGEVKNGDSINTSNIKAGVYLLMVAGYIPRRLVLLNGD